MKPLRLPANQLERFYRGGPRIARLRGGGGAGDYAPEDWVGATVTTFGSDTVGLQRLEDGSTLRDAIGADPEGFLGPEHASLLGADPALLVKLLDAGQRLPVHFHPDRDFARRNLGSAYGKTESWIVLEAEGDDPAVHLAFREDVALDTLAGWVERQDSEAMLDAMHRLAVAPGDAIFVPAGLPHSIGEGLLIVELQEPSDFSVLLEWEGFALDGAQDGHLGLGFPRALEAGDRSGWSSEQLEALRARRRDGGRPGADPLFPAEADRFFRAERLKPAPELALPAEFSILVVTEGQGTLAAADAELELRRGETVLVPWAAGETTVSGGLEALRCLPARPEHLRGLR